MTSPSRRAHVVGVGLIGASLARALSALGWLVTGQDHDPQVVSGATAAGIIVGDAGHEDTSLVIVATPAGTVVEAVRRRSRALRVPS